MVDKITMTTNNRELISRIKYNLSVADPSIVKKNRYSRYHVYNREIESDCFFLKVDFDSQNYPSCTITNSIRKWYYGKCSINDLSRSDTYKAFSLLAQTLAIDLEELKTFAVSKIEVGLNFYSKYDNTLIKSLATKYISAAYKMRDCEGSRTFSRSKVAHSLIIYNKVLEIKRGINLIKDDAEEKFCKETMNANITRIEVIFNDSNAKTKYNCNIRKVKDIIDHYCWLTVCFDKAIKRLSFKDTLVPNFTPQKGSVKELTDYLYAYAIEDLGEVLIRDYIAKLPKCKHGDARKAILKRIRSNVKSSIEKDYLLKVIRDRNRELISG